MIRCIPSDEVKTLDRSFSVRLLGKEDDVSNFWGEENEKGTPTQAPSKSGSYGDVPKPSLVPTAVSLFVERSLLLRVILFE